MFTSGGRKITRYESGKEGHIKFNCPKFQAEGQKPDKASAPDIAPAMKRERKPLTAWKKAKPDVIAEMDVLYKLQGSFNAYL
jgi:hypothetical protein